MPPANIVFGSLAQIEDALGEAIARAKEGPGQAAGHALAPVTVLVDNSLLKQQLPRAFAKRGAAQINVRYFRPDELARSLAVSSALALSSALEAQAPDAAASPRLTRPRLTRDAERFLVREIAAGAGGYFAAIAGREGFADALGRLFRELEMGGFATSSASRSRSLPRALGADSADASADESSKAGQIARLFAEYLKRRSA